MSKAVANYLLSSPVDLTVFFLVILRHRLRLRRRGTEQKVITRLHYCDESNSLKASTCVYIWNHSDTPHTLVPAALLRAGDDSVGGQR